MRGAAVSSFRLLICFRKTTEIPTGRPSVMTSNPQTTVPGGGTPLLPSFEELGR